MLIISWIVYTLAIIISAYILPGVAVNNFWTALITAFVLALLNMFIKPILILFTLPLNLLTLGLFTFVINALLILLAAQIVPGFRVDGFGWALLFGIILALISTVLFSIVQD